MPFNTFTVANNLINTTSMVFVGHCPFHEALLTFVLPLSKDLVLRTRRRTLLMSTVLVTINVYWFAIFCA